MFLEVDILDSFNLKDGQNGVQATTSCKVGNGYYFGRTSKDITAVDEVLKEVVGLLTQHHSFIITFKVRPEPYHKGSILWLEQKRTGTTFLSETQLSEHRFQHFFYCERKRLIQAFFIRIEKF